MSILYFHAPDLPPVPEVPIPVPAPPLPSKLRVHLIYYNKATKNRAIRLVTLSPAQFIAHAQLALSGTTQLCGLEIIP